MKGPRRKKEWFDDDSFWRVLYPFMFTPQRIADADAHMEKALALTKPTGKAALDLCCGPGRCSLALAKRGFRVTGVDRTAFLLNRARSRARSQGAPVEWVRSDARDFVRPGAFALAVSMFTSFGYFDDKHEDQKVLDNVFRSLQPGGAFLIELVGKEQLAKMFQHTTSTSLPDGSILVQRHRILDDWTRVDNEWFVIRKNRLRRFAFHHTIYSGQELRDRLERAGFSVSLYGNLDGAAYGPHAERLIAIGRKPAAGA